MVAKTLDEPKLTACRVSKIKTQRQMTASQQPNAQHWLWRTPTEFLNQYVADQWRTCNNHAEFRKIRYFSFTIRTFVFRGDRLFLTNRNTNPNVMEELTVPTDRFDVSLASLEDRQPPLYQVHQPEERSLSEHVKTVLSARYQHPNILQNARFMQELSFGEPLVRRWIEATTYGEDELYLCDTEVSIILSKYDGSLGSGPAFRWVTESEAAKFDDGLRFVSGLTIFHIQEIFSLYRQCRQNQVFHEHCTEQIRSILRNRWRQGDVERCHRYGVIAQKDGLEGHGVWIFTMSAMDAAKRKETPALYYENVWYNIVGRFAIEAVQLRPEVEVWRSVVDKDGSVRVGWREDLSRMFLFRTVSSPT